MLQTFYWKFVVKEWHAHFHRTSNKQRPCVHFVYIQVNVILIFVLQCRSCFALSIQWCIGYFLFIFVHGNVIMCELDFFSLCLFISFSNTFVRKTHVLLVVRFCGRVFRINHENRHVIISTPNIYERLIQ